MTKTCEMCSRFFELSPKSETHGICSVARHIWMVVNPDHPDPSVVLRDNTRAENCGLLSIKNNNNDMFPSQFKVVHSDKEVVSLSEKVLRGVQDDFVEKVLELQHEQFVAESLKTSFTDKESKK